MKGLMAETRRGWHLTAVIGHVVEQWPADDAAKGLLSNVGLDVQLALFSIREALATHPTRKGGCVHTSVHGAGMGKD